MSNSTLWWRFHGEDEVPSPSLILHRSRIQENIRRMIAIAGGPDRLRPHLKTHKMRAVMRLQLDAGIRRYKCATLAEAEMAAGCGSIDLLVAAQLVGPNIQRYLGLVKRYPNVKFSSLVDDEHAAAVLGAAARDSGRVLEVWLDIDCGQHRTGVSPGPSALDLCEKLRQIPGLQLAGLHAYDGHLHDLDPVVRENRCRSAFAEVFALRRQLGLVFSHPIELVAGGTPTFPFHARNPEVQCSPGTPLLWDAGYAKNLPDLDFLPAAVLLTRVVSKPGGNRLCFDLGHKAVASEGPHPRAVFLEIPDAHPIAHNEEHLVIETGRANEFAVGSAAWTLPWHICPTVALYSQVFVVESGATVGIWNVSARERLLEGEKESTPVP